MNWNDLKPSTSPDLLRREVEALPAGMIIVAQPGNEVCLITKGGFEAWDNFLVWGATLGSGDSPSWQGPFGPLSARSHLRLPKLPRMSFALTTDAVRSRQKDVTRRLELPRWWHTERWFLGVDKVRSAGAQGLCIAQCVSARKELLSEITQEEVNREGFPHTTPKGFVAMFRGEVKDDSDLMVWRLEFRYLEVPK